MTDFCRYNLSQDMTPEHVHRQRNGKQNSFDDYIEVIRTYTGRWDS